MNKEQEVEVVEEAEAEAEEVEEVEIFRGHPLAHLILCIQ
jgi:hypothetical protein